MKRYYRIRLVDQGEMTPSNLVKVIFPNCLIEWASVWGKANQGMI